MFWAFEAIQSSVSEPKKHGAGTRDTQELCMQLAADKDDSANRFTSAA